MQAPRGRLRTLRGFAGRRPCQRVLAVVVGSCHAAMLLPLLPLLGWLVLYLATLRWFVPQLARVTQSQADARSLMTGRITDAYTNIATVKLFAHDHKNRIQGLD